MLTHAIAIIDITIGLFFLSLLMLACLPSRYGRLMGRRIRGRTQRGRPF